MKTLYKSHNKMIAGVCAGIADYFQWDVTIVRLALVLLTIFTGMFPFVIFYIIAALIMPESNILS